jgi:hypothetical protein
MKISKINTGIYNILLIQVPTDKIFEVELDKEDKILKVDDNVIELKDYLDETYREIKVLGLLYLMKGNQFSSLVELDTVYRRFWHTNKFKKKFYDIISEEGWDLSDKETLVVRI